MEPANPINPIMFHTSTDPPAQPTLTSSTTDTKTGSTVVLTCTTSQSGLDFKWYKGNELIPNQVGNTLTLTSVSPSSGGSYTCTVSSSVAGESTPSVAVTLTVEGKFLTNFDRFCL